MPPLGDRIRPLLQAKYPPDPHNPSELGFNIQHYAEAMAKRTKRTVVTERRRIQKVIKGGEYPREPWIANLCALLGISPADLPARPIPLDRGALMARDVLADSLAAVRAGRPEDADAILEKALRWFDDYHAAPSPPRSAQAKP